MLEGGREGERFGPYRWVTQQRSFGGEEIADAADEVSKSRK